MATTELKGLMIGAGWFAQFHAEGWQRLGASSPASTTPSASPGCATTSPAADARIMAVADAVPGRAAEFAARWGIPHAYESAAEMIRREPADFLDIVTRPDTHLEFTRLGAARGLHVICQKPMANTMEDAAAMVAACEAAGVRLLIHENWRWQAWYREVKRLLEAGAVGRVFHVGFRMRTGDGRGPQPYSNQPYMKKMERLLVADTLIHFIDTFAFLVGPVTSVFCRTARVNPAIRGEDYALVQLSVGGGANGLIDANRISGRPTPAFGTLHVEGELGEIRMDPEGRLFITEHGGDERPHAYPLPAVGYRGDSVRAFQQHAIECLRTGARSESEGRDYLATTMAATFACYRSLETGRAVALPSGGVASTNET
jgi:D-apiose dehydrogenase